MPTDWFAQSGARSRLEWGRRGARAATGRGDMLVVVDVLRFSSAVAAAVAAGVEVYPCLDAAEAAAVAARVGGAAGRQPGARFSLSPLSYAGAAPGTRFALPSPNGATCVRVAAAAPLVVAGCPLNAAAVGRYVSARLDGGAPSVTVLACGERWEDEGQDGPLRFAVEDYLGAGAILSHITHPLSPEAAVCAAAFAASRDRLPELLRGCGSGVELAAKGLAADVEFCSRLDFYTDVVPALKDGCFTTVRA